MLLIVLLCVVGLALCQEKRWSKSTTKHRDKSFKDKYDPDYADKTREEDSEEQSDRNSAYISDFLPDKPYRNNRAIDNSKYVRNTHTYMIY